MPKKKNWSARKKHRNGDRRVAAPEAVFRQPRSDKKTPEESFSARKMIKFTRAGYREMESQAAIASFAESSAYIRYLLEQDRRRLRLRAYTYNPPEADDQVKSRR